MQALGRLMDWIRSGLKSLSGLLQPQRRPGTQACSDPLETIRCSMLEALGPAGAAQHPGLVARIRFCREVETLWALCLELMDVSSQLYGDSHARRQLSRITFLFQDLRPQAACPQRNRMRSRMARWRRH